MPIFFHTKIIKYNHIFQGKRINAVTTDITHLSSAPTHFIDYDKWLNSCLKIPPLERYPKFPLQVDASYLFSNIWSTFSRLHYYIDHFHRPIAVMTRCVQHSLTSICDMWLYIYLAVSGLGGVLELLWELISVLREQSINNNIICVYLSWVECFWVVSAYILQNFIRLWALVSTWQR